MNLRMDGQHIRFRIDAAECNRLLTGEPLRSATVLPGNRVWTAIVALDPLSTGPDLSADLIDDILTVRVSAAAVMRLHKSLPSKQGLEASQPLPGHGALTLALDVDVRLPNAGHAPRRVV